jgi:hypothetical protein
MGSSGSKAQQEFSNQLKELQVKYMNGDLPFPEKMDVFFMERSEPLFQAADKDNNGFLDVDELFCLCRDVILAQIETTVSFAKKSGAPSDVTEQMKLTLEDVLKEPTFSDAVKRVLKKMDGNGDGKISIDEFKESWHTEVMKFTTGGSDTIDVSKIGLEDVPPTDPNWPGETSNLPSTIRLEVQHSYSGGCFMRSAIETCPGDTLAQLYAAYMEHQIKSWMKNTYLSDNAENRAKVRVQMIDNAKATWAIAVTRSKDSGKKVQTPVLLADFGTVTLESLGIDETSGATQQSWGGWEGGYQVFFEKEDKWDPSGYNFVAMDRPQ